LFFVLSLSGFYHYYGKIGLLFGHQAINHTRKYRTEKNSNPKGLQTQIEELI